MKCLVTGATGFVGQWLTKFLIRQGLAVKVFCRDPSKAPHNIEVVQGDICNAEVLVKAISGVDVVYHVAGFVGYSKKHLKIMQDVNVQGTQNVIDACIKNHTQRLIHISSVSAIGASLTPNVLNEDSDFSIQHLQLGYFQTKKQAEDLVKKYVKSGKINAVILNPATIYGAGDMKKSSRRMQLKVAKGHFPFYPPGGVNVIDIESVVKAIYTATQKGISGERYILAGENILIKDLFKIIAKMTNKRPPFLPIPKPFLRLLGVLGDVLEKSGKNPPITSEIAWMSTLFHWFDSSKAQAELDLKPQPAHIAIKNSIDWAIQNHLV